MIKYQNGADYYINSKFLLLSMILSSFSAHSQVSRTTSTKIQGNIEINAQSDNMSAVATGTNSVAKNRVGVVNGKHKGNTNVSASVKNITTVASGRDRKACTTIGGVTNEECK